ncbi:MAG: hypothetical protein WD061_03560 [Candidatus Saccharimonadales bacterium]
MKHILILEDLLEVQAALIKELAKLEEKLAEDIFITSYSNSSDVEKIVNQQPIDSYDVIILDRNAKDGGTFHILDINRFGLDKIISTSSMPSINKQLLKQGVAGAVDKDLNHLEEFASEVIDKLEKILAESKSLRAR